MANPVMLGGLFMLVSGFCSLVYQTAWFRLLHHVFGTTQAATAAVLAIFMGGLGLGGRLLGERVDRTDRPLRLYARLELGIALTVAITPLLVGLAQTLYLATGGSQALGGGATLVRLVLATLILGAPTFLMGGTLPALARGIESQADLSRRHTSLLYGLNTLGAVAGVVFTTFYGIEALGVRNTLWVACGVNLVLGGLGLVWSTRAAPSSEAVAAALPLELPRRLILGVSAVVGFAFFTMELVWYRMLTPLMGGTTFTFGLILATALVGIGLGSLAYGLRDAARRPTLMTFALTCALQALVIAVPYALGDRMMYAAWLLWPTAEVSFGWSMLGWTLITGVAVLPGALVAGFQFPVLLALAGSGAHDVGRDVGQVYAWNTAGAILGSLLGSFVLIPLLGAVGTWLAVVLVLVLTSLGMAVASSRESPSIAGLVMVALLASLALGTRLAEGPTAVWRHGGRVGALPDSPNGYQDWLRERRRWVLLEEEGVETSFAIARQDSLAMLNNGRPDGHLFSDSPTAVNLGLYAAIRHPEPRTALVIGLASGQTAGWLAAVPSIERVDVVELEPATVTLARLSAPLNRDVLDNPKVNIIFGDGREVLALRENQYDLVVSEPSNPYRVGVGNLFTQDFYRQVESRLAPGGIFVQWLQAYNTEPVTVRTIYATLLTVFPEVETWEGVMGSDVGFLVSREPIPHDVEQLRERLQTDPYGPALSFTDGLHDVEGLYASFLGNGDFARMVAEAHDGPINTDDRPVFEYAAARNVGRKGSFSLRELRASAEIRGMHQPPGARGMKWVKIKEYQSVIALAHNTAVPPPPVLEPRFRARWSAREAYRLGDLLGAAQRWGEQDKAPLCDLDLTMLAESLAVANHESAPAFIEELRRRRPVEGALAATQLALATGDNATAIDELTTALTLLRTSPWNHPAMVHRGLRNVQRLASDAPSLVAPLFEATRLPYAGFLLDDSRRFAHIEVARAVGDPRACVEAYGQVEPWLWWNRSVLAERLACYEKAGEEQLIARARAELAQFDANVATPFSEGFPASQMGRHIPAP